MSCNNYLKPAKNANLMLNEIHNNVNIIEAAKLSNLFD